MENDQEMLAKMKADEKVKDFVKVLKEKSLGLLSINGDLDYENLYSYFIKEYVTKTKKVAELFKRREREGVSKELISATIKAQNEGVFPLLAKAGFLQNF